jgi:hypothetical protein
LWIALRQIEAIETHSGYACYAFLICWEPFLLYLIVTKW